MEKAREFDYIYIEEPDDYVPKHYILRSGPLICTAYE